MSPFIKEGLLMPPVRVLAGIQYVNRHAGPGKMDGTQACHSCWFRFFM